MDVPATDSQQQSAEESGPPPFVPMRVQMDEHIALVMAPSKLRNRKQQVQHYYDTLREGDPARVAQSIKERELEDYNDDGDGDELIADDKWVEKQNREYEARLEREWDAMTPHEVARQEYLRAQRLAPDRSHAKRPSKKILYPAPGDEELKALRNK